MYLTSHHVVSRTTGEDGINSFLYSHGASTWRAPPPDIPDENPGILLAKSISVAPPGNDVRSYLDIVAPDEAPWNEVRIGFMAFVGSAQRGPLPWAGVSGRCYFRLGMVFALAREWQKELAVLYRASQALRLANPA